MEVASPPPWPCSFESQALQ
uniref:Uncharacterized protein n=1 Tax=Arundo donax TaxID=35708 RepID=A0A0A8Z3K3_ARUDO